MQKAIPLALLLLSIIGINPAKAQSQKLEIIYEQTENGYDFYCDNPNNSPYLVKINFTLLKNLRPNFSLKKEITVTTGKQRIFTLKKERENQSTNFNYKWSYRKGSLPVKHKSDTPYLLPLKERRLTKTLKVVYVGEVIGKSEQTPEGYYCIGFTMNKGDTVAAARSGRVIEVVADIDPAETHLLMHKQRNYVEILHKDGTIGKYQLFQKESVFVEEGDFVVAGNPLGIVDSEHYEHGPHIRFQVYYAKEGEGYGYITPKFYSSEKVKILNFAERYKVKHPKDLILSELSKRQKKKYRRL